MPNQFVEFHDSELAVLWFEKNDEAILVFSHVYIHESEGSPGVDDGIVWFQRAELVIKNARYTKFVATWPFSIYAGETEIDGVIQSNGFSLPIECRQSFRIQLEGVDDGGNGEIKKMEVGGSGAILTLLGKRGPVTGGPVLHL